MNRRIVAWFLAIFAFLLFCCSGTLVQTAKAVVGVDDAIIAIIIAALAAMGITFVTTGAFSNTNDYVQSLLEEFAADRGTSVSSLMSGAQSGTNSLGQIILNNRFLVVIETFAMWIKAKFSLTNNNTVTIQREGAYVAGMPVTLLPVTVFNGPQNNYHDGYTIISANAEAFVADCAGVIYGFAEEVSTFRVVVIGYAPDGKVNYTYENSYTTNFLEKRYNIDGTIMVLTPDRYSSAMLEIPYGVPGLPELTILQAQTMASSSAPLINAEGIIINTGNIVLPSDDSEYTEGDGAILDVGADWGDTYDEVIDVIIDGFEDDKVGEAEIVYENEDEAQQQVTDTAGNSVSSDVSEYQVEGLASVFPFCIPFDIYSFFECLAADPVAPVVNWRFYVPGICDETITLDLSQFNTVAQIVRTMELLAFIVGLALVTREKFLRG